MAKYIKHELNYKQKKDKEDISHILTIKEYGGLLKKCPVCGLEAVIVEYSGIGYVGCPLSHMVYCGHWHPSEGYSGRGRTTKTEAIRKWNER